MQDPHFLSCLGCPHPLPSPGGALASRGLQPLPFPALLWAVVEGLCPGPGHPVYTVVVTLALACVGVARHTSFPN